MTDDCQTRSLQLVPAAYKQDQLLIRAADLTYRMTQSMYGTTTGCITEEL